MINAYFWSLEMYEILDQCVRISGKCIHLTMSWFFRHLSTICHTPALPWWEDRDITDGVLFPVGKRF